MSLTPSSRAEMRRSWYKLAVDADEGRKRRAYSMFMIRNDRRKERLQEKRRMDSDPRVYIAKKMKASLEIRRRLSLDRWPPIEYSECDYEELIRTVGIRRLFKFVTRDDFPRLQDAKVVIDHGVLMIFLKLLVSARNDVRELCIVDHQALPHLQNLLAPYQEKTIKKDACWTISNITAGNKEQIKAVIDADIIVSLVRLLRTAEFDIKTEAAWAISNALCCGDHEQIKSLVTQGCIKPLCDHLVCHDAQTVAVCLEGLEGILRMGEAEKNMGATEGVNLYAQMIDEAEGLEKIESLQYHHDNTDVHEKSVKMMESYWPNEENDAAPSGDGEQTGLQLGKKNETAPPGGF